jgi:hypothetical protein
MIIETIFYITGSIFFVLVVAINVMVAIFLYKLLSTFVKISEEINDTARDIRGKVSNFYVGFAGLAALLEKLINFSFKKGESGGEERKETTQREKQESGEEIKTEKSSAQAKKEKKVKKIKVFEISEE